MADNELLKKLRATREDYGAELAWHRFLLDAYTGTGGFAGRRVKQPAVAFLGWAAETYSDTAVQLHSQGAELETYLDRYPREDDPKFRRRIDVAHYPNFVEMILDMLLGYVTKRELARDKIPDRITEWMGDVDGNGTDWDELVTETQLTRTALLGWTPMLFDSPVAVEGNRQATDAAGIKPKAIPLFPGNLLDWEYEDGRFNWVKVKLPHCRRASALADAVKSEEIQIWYRERVEKYEIFKTKEGERVEELGEFLNPWGHVPVIVWRQKPSPQDPVRGLGMVDAIAPLVRRLFNYVSELDEHLRSSVFAQLQVPYDPTGQKPSEIVVGSDNALGLPFQSKHEFKWIAPPESVAATLEERIANCITAIMWLARIEQPDRGKQVQSGVSKAYDFEKTNGRLRKFAAQVAKSDRACLVMVGLMLGMRETELQDISVTGPADFRVEDLATDLANALSALELGLPPTVEMWVKKRVVEKMLPNLPEDEKAFIFDELEKQRDEAVQREVEDREVDKAKAQREIDGTDPENNGEPTPGA